jgi:hypothetical protein
MVAESFFLLFLSFQIVWILIGLAGRRLEIFLDYLTSYALSCEDYLFNPSYESLLNDEESKFAAEMANFFSKSVWKDID